MLDIKTSKTTSRWFLKEKWARGIIWILGNIRPLKGSKFRPENKARSRSKQSYKICKNTFPLHWTWKTLKHYISVQPKTTGGSFDVLVLIWLDVSQTITNKVNILHVCIFLKSGIRILSRVDKRIYVDWIRAEYTSAGVSNTENFPSKPLFSGRYLTAGRRSATFASRGLRFVNDSLGILYVDV